jgi:alginate O-acetyltransferase complex protein AlgJ
MAKKKQLTREEIAAIELGHTEIGPLAAKVFSIIFIVLIIAIPGIHVIRHGSAVGSIFPAIGAAFKTSSPKEFNDTLKKGFHDYEDSINETTPVREAFLEPLQQFLLTALKTGNEKVIVGKDGYLFYPEDVDYLLEPGFMRQARQWKRKQSEVQPDPVQAIVKFKNDLKERGIRLIVLPVPVKVCFYGDKLHAAKAYLENKDYRYFLDVLKQNEVDVLDLNEDFHNLQLSGTQPFLKTDTHWTPEAMDLAADRCAKMLGCDNALPDGDMVTITNIGDTAALLKLKENPYPPETVTIKQFDMIPDPSSDVLILGDSFVNIYSMEAMNWGVRGGFSEHLAARLDRQIDVIARNDGGDYASRSILARELARGRDRLDGKKSLIWVFSARKLPAGDWKDFDLAVGKAQDSAFLTIEEPKTVTATVLAVTTVPRPNSAPYKDHVMSLHLGDIEGNAEALVYIASMRDNVWTDAARLRIGDTVKIELKPWADHEDEYGSWNRSEFEDGDLILQEPCWGELTTEK